MQLMIPMGWCHEVSGRRRSRAGLVCLLLLTGAGHAVADGWDPGDDTGAGGTLLTPTATAQVHGPHTLSLSDCEDWYRISMLAGSIYHFDTEGGSGDNVAYLYSDAAGMFQVDWDDDSGGGLQFSFTYTAAATQIYYLQVVPYGGCGPSWSGSVRYWTGAAGPPPLSSSNWTTTGLWHGISDTAAPIGRPFSSSSATTFWYGLDATGTYNTGAPNSGTLYSPAMSIPASSTLGFLSWAQTENVPGYDLRRISISTNGGATWTLLQTLAGTENVWQDVRQGLAAYAGQTAIFGFYFTTVDSSFNNYQGWYIDDLRILSPGPPGGLAATVAMVPSASIVGQTFQVRLTVTNTGGSTVTGVLPAIQLNTGTALVAPWPGPAPAGPVTLAAGAAQTFTWTFTAAGAGTVTLTATATGSGGLTASAPGSVVIAAGGSLAAALSITPATALSGSTVTLVMSVTNTGASTINGLLAGVTPVSGTSLVAAVSGPSPAGPVTLAAGAVQRFTWVYSVTGTGSANMVATAAGTDAVTSAFVGIGATRVVTIVRPAALAVHLSLTPPVTVPGGVVTVVASITNTGGSTANTVDASLSTGCCITGPISSPVPAPFLTIAAGTSARFTWSFTATGMGTSTFTTWISGVDTALGGALAASDSEPLTSKAALVPAALGVDVVIANDPAAVGQWVTSVVAVTNTGDYSATGVTPALTISGIPYTTILGPVPAGPVALPPLQTAFFTWTISPSGSGSASVSVGATGTDTSPGGGAISVTAEMPPFIVRYSRLLASLSAPRTGRRSGTVEVRMTVTNAGSGTANGLVPTVGGPGVAIVAGPAPAGGSLVAGGVASFDWTLRLETAGTILLAGGITGVDATGGLPVAAFASATIIVNAGFDEPLVVYPNPVRGDLLQIGVRAKAPAKSFRAEIWNVARERVYQGTWQVTTADASLDIRGVAGWAPGLYAVRVTAELADGSTESFPFVRLTVRR